MNKYHLIRLAVFIKIVGHGFARRSQRNMQIAVYQYRFAAFQIIIFRLNIKPDEAGMLQVLFAGYFRLNRIRFTQSSFTIVGG